MQGLHFAPAASDRSGQFTVNYLNPNEVAAELRVDRRTVYNWMRSGDLPAVKVGRTWRVSHQDIESKKRGR